MVPRVVGTATVTETSVRQRRPVNPPPPLALGAVTPTRVDDGSHDDSPKLGLPEPSVLQTTTMSNRNAFVSAIAPVSLLGGTAAVYSAVLRHPSSTLTPLSLMYMVLLALQYTLQPRLSRRYISRNTNKRTVALAEETVKTLLAAGMFCATGLRNMQHHVSRWTWQSSLAVAGLPAVLYAVQGVLQYTAYQYLDPVTFNGLVQTKTLAAAASCYLLLGQRQSSWQMVALVLLTGSALLFQNGGSLNSSKKPSSASASSAAAAKEEARTVSTSSSSSTQPPDPKQQQQHEQQRWMLGVVPCLLATLLSGLAGALSVKGLQLTGDGRGHGRDAYLFTMEVSLFSAAVLLANILTSGSSNSSNSNQQSPPKEGQRHASSSVFHGWTRATWVPVIWKALGGVLTALVHQSSGSVTKGFALMLGLVLSGVLQSAVMREGEILPHQVVGTLLVLLSGWLHFTNPVV